MIRIPHSLHQAVASDLKRAHAFAFERVGFLFAAQGTTPNGQVLLAKEYMSISDDLYLDMPSVGAAISGEAIRQALQRALRLGASAFHIHAHEGTGIPFPSRVDQQGYAKMIPSFSAIMPTVPHGAIILSDDNALGLTWLPGASQPTTMPIRIIGFPFGFWSSP